MTAQVHLLMYGGTERQSRILGGGRRGLKSFLSVHNKMTLNVPWTPIHLPKLKKNSGSAHGGLYRKKRHLKLREYLVI